MVSRKSPDAEDWILLSTAVARMAELHPAYRTYPGYARRDLEKMIRADRARLRDSATEPPLPISGPITSRNDVDLLHNRIRERRPGPTGSNWPLFCIVQIEWNTAAVHLQQFAVLTFSIQAAITSPNSAVSKRAKGAKPTKRSAASLFINRQYPDGIPIGVTNKMIAQEIKIKEGVTVTERTIRRARGGN